MIIFSRDIFGKRSKSSILRKSSLNIFLCKCFRKSSNCLINKEKPKKKKTNQKEKDKPSVSSAVDSKLSKQFTIALAPVLWRWLRTFANILGMAHAKHLTFCMVIVLHNVKQKNYGTMVTADVSIFTQHYFRKYWKNAKTVPIFCELEFSIEKRFLKSVLIFE